jgi:hypothetical protein
MNRLLLPVDGPPIASEQDALDIIGEAMGQGAELVVIPVMRLSPEFFRLASSVAGAMLQKFTNYQLRVTIVGDVSAYTNRSVPFADFVRESNRRGAIRFVNTEAEL